MLSAKDLRGIMGMMPAFTTADGGDLRAKATIDVAALRAGVDRIIGDGIDVIATTGSFGEFHTLLWDEHKTLIEATVGAVKSRVPVFIGCTSLNTRETLEKMEFIAKSGADGVLVGVPHYFPSTVENASQFYKDVAAAFPRLAIMVYHNPPLHHVKLPESMFAELAKIPNIVAMKDSHRDTQRFMRLQEVTGGKISVFCNQAQLYPYAMLGAAGCWSIHAWMGPSPIIRMRDACRAGDWEAAKKICMDVAQVFAGGPITGDLRWRESSIKLAMNEAGYCRPGPLRPPFRVVPDAVREAAKEMAAKWTELCRRYPLQAAAPRHAAE